MANLKDIKRRIGSVKSTQKITNAMKLVSAAKFARANAAVEASRPYAEAFKGMVGRLIASEGAKLESQLLTQLPLQTHSFSPTSLVIEVHQYMLHRA